MTKLPTSQQILVCLLALGMIGISSGCKSGAFKKPDLSGLAFWKKDSAATELPPPPARHFDPAPLENEALAKSTSKASDRLDKTELARQIQREIEDTKKQLADAKDELQGSPIRKPYSLDGISGGTKPLSSNSFQAAAKSVTNEFKSSKDKLTTAQKEFNSAIASVGNEFSNDKTAKPEEGAWKKFKLPTELSQAKSSVNSALQSVNKSLYDSNGKLNTAALKNGAAKASNAFADASSKIEGSFESANEFGLKTPSSFKPPANAVPKPKNFPLAGASAGTEFSGMVEKVSSNLQSAKTNTQLALEAFKKKKPAVLGATVNNIATEAMDRVASAKDSMLAPISKPAKNENAIALQKMQAEMAAARQQIEMLKQQVASATQPTTNVSPKTATTPQKAVREEPTSQLQIPRFSGISKPRSNLNVPPPVNQLRGMVSTPKNLTSQTPSTNDNGFQSTGFDGLATKPAAKPASTSNPAMQANYMSTGMNSPIGQSATKASIDVEIPDSVLKGSGSYAPGSVFQLLEK